MKKQIFTLLLVLFSFINLFNPVMAQWVQTKGAGGGNIIGLFVDGNRVFAGTEGGGAMVSTDNGQNWTPVNLGFNSPIVTCFFRQGNLLFAGTGKGIFKSTNDGQTWQESNTGMVIKQINSIAASGTNLLACTKGAGLYVSTNQGQSWTAIGTGLHTDVQSFIDMGTHWLAGGAAGGISKSTNQGTSWQAANNGMMASSVYAFTKNASTLFAATNNGLYTSTNAGDSWTRINTITGIPTCFQWNGSTLVMGLSQFGISQSTDNGQNWSPISQGLTNTSVNSLALINNILLAGTLGHGVFRRAENSSSWAEANRGLPASKVYDLQSVGNSLWAATGSGIQVSTDMGQTWTRKNTGLPLSLPTAYMSAIHQHNGVLLTASNSGVYRSTNNGDSWALANSGITSTSASRYKTIISSGNTIFVGSTNRGVFKSTNNGESWTAAATGLLNQSINQLVAIAPDNKLLAATGNGVFTSTNGGDSWTKTSIGLPVGEVYSLVQLENILFATVSNAVFKSVDGGANWTSASFPQNAGIDSEFMVFDDKIWVNTIANGIYRSSDLGSTWETVNEGLPSYTNVFLKPMCGVVHQNTLFIGTENQGVWGFGLTTSIANSWSTKAAGQIIFPNPARQGDMVRISAPVNPNASALLFDMQGKKIANLQLAKDGSTTLPANLQPGMYWLHVSDREGTRLVIQP